MWGKLLNPKFVILLKKIFCGLVFHMVGCLTIVTNSQGGVLSHGFSMFQQIQEDGAQQKALLHATVQEVYRYDAAMAVWYIANPASLPLPAFPLKEFRDPFAPIEKRSSVQKSPSPPTTTKLPLSPPLFPGKLVSVVRGPRGYQAVIQLLTKEYCIVELGEVVAHTGWRVTDIKDDRVRLEVIQSSSSDGSSQYIKSANLFF